MAISGDPHARGSKLGVQATVHRHDGMQEIASSHAPRNDRALRLARLLYDLGGLGEHGAGNGDPERVGSLEVDDQVEA